MCERLPGLDSIKSNEKTKIAIKIHDFSIFSILTILSDLTNSTHGK